MTDLRHLLPKVRDQGDRGTCLSIAVNDGHHAVRATGPSLSIDYLHYHGVLRDEVGINEGVSLYAIREALLEDGHPAENECPYSTTERPPDWVPSAPQGDVWKRRSASPPPSWQVISAALRNNEPVVLVLGITDAFWEASEGTIEASDGISRGRHAVLAVGLHPTENRVLVRNSWGEEWGIKGYGWLSALYIQARCVSVITFGDVLP